MTKTISLSDDAYEALAALKRPGESFSELALRMSRAQSAAGILGLAGAWKGRDAELDAMLASIYRARDESASPPVDLQ
jgi:predicted CopG family antitoxin